MFLNLRAEMARGQVTQKQIADVAGVSTRSVWSWLSEDTEPSVGKAIAIKKALFPNLDVEYLFDPTGKQPKE